MLIDRLQSTGLSDKELFNILQEDGINTVGIANIFSIDRHTVSKFSSSELQIRTFNFMPEDKGDEQGYSTCYICHKTDLNKNFPVREIKGIILYTLSYCATCKEIEQNNPLRRNSKARLLAHKEALLRNRRKITTVQLPYGYISFLYRRQQGLCFYTDRIMDLANSLPQDNSLSVDRINCKKDYSYSNIVLCVNKANIVKYDMSLEEMSSWTPEWYKRIMRFQQEIPSLLIEGNFYAS